MRRIRQELANVLAQLISEKGQPMAQIAKELGYSRQRLFQLKTADRSALPEAIEEAINKLGYEVETISIRPIDSPHA